MNKNLRLFSTQLINFVPKHKPCQESDVRKLEDFIWSSSKLLIITGAGISTESGIPDYRSEEVGLYARSNHSPIKHQEFIKSANIRRRYWARNFIGWPRFSTVEPNLVHYYVSDLESMGQLSGVVTQNVDSLHFKAGSKNVTELHGTAFRVKCLECPATYSRYEVQEKLHQLNPNLGETVISDMIRPDGDVEIDQKIIETFNPPLCDQCGRGPLKPDIVFFGDNVPRNRVDFVRNLVQESDSVLVLGSSLSVFSGFRIILQAQELEKKIAIVNIGNTRADNLADLKIQAKCGDILARIMK